MKTKFLLGFLLAFICLLGFSSCKGFKGETQNIDDQAVTYHDYDGVVQDFTAMTAHIQALHRQRMLSIIQNLQADGHTIVPEGQYQWRNSLVILNDTATAENIGDLHIVSIRDVFFYLDNQRGPQLQYITDHVKYGTQIPWPINDVWIDDRDMSNAHINISAEEALTRLKEWNGILPKDCNFIILRLPVGPNDCNPQWTFGDVGYKLFIDAVTGEIRDYDPAFGPTEQPAELVSEAPIGE